MNVRERTPRPLCLPYIGRVCVFVVVCSWVLFHVIFVLLISLFLTTEELFVSLFIVVVVAADFSSFFQEGCEYERARARVRMCMLCC